MITYWWFRPSRIALFVAMPITFLAYAASDRFYQQFGAFNAITDDRFFVAWLSVLSFAGASWLAEVVVPPRRQELPPRIRESNFQVLLFGLAIVAMMATLVFLAPFISHPALVADVLKGEAGASFMARRAVNQIPGFTSAENLFSTVVVLFMLKPVLTGRKRTPTEKVVVGVILGLTVLKAVLHTERLSLIELIVPLCLLVGATRRSRSALWDLAPIAGTGALVMFFTGTEYLRSWVTYYSAKSDSVFDFAVDRMLGYYMTAINNGAFVYGEIHTYYFPFLSATWLWRLPIPGFQDFLTSISGEKIDYMTLLSPLNPEFNSPSGIFPVLIDFGPVLGVLIWGMLGYVSGRLFRSFSDGRYAGFLIFPTWYVGVLEIPREFYWGDARYFPPLLISCSIVLIFTYLLPRQASAATHAVNRQGMAFLPHEIPGPYDASGRHP